MARTEMCWKRDIRKLCEEFMVEESSIDEIIMDTENANISDDYYTRYNFAHRMFVSAIREM